MLAPLLLAHLQLQRRAQRLPRQSIRHGIPCSPLTAIRLTAFPSAIRGITCLRKRSNRTILPRSGPNKSWKPSSPAPSLSPRLWFDDAYPNTTFASGHLQFAVNSSVTEETCRSFVESAKSGWPVAGGTTFLSGIAMQWSERDSVSTGNAYINRDYAGFSNGTCYEFFLEVASTAALNSDGPSSRADIVKVRRPLEKTVSSLELRAPAALPHAN